MRTAHSQAVAQKQFAVRRRQPSERNHLAKDPHRSLNSRVKSFSGLCDRLRLRCPRRGLRKARTTGVPCVGHDSLNAVFDSDYFIPSPSFPWAFESWCFRKCSPAR